MKVTSEKSYLAAALAATGRAISSRNTLPILANVLIETEGDRLRLTATDLDTAIRCLIPANVGTAGAVAVPAHLLSDVVSKLPDGPVTLEAQDGKVFIRAGKSDYTILSLPAEDYPVVPDVSGEGVTEFSIPQRTLKDLLKYTTFAASNEESRSVFMGVLFEAGDGRINAVATDTHRLALKHADAPAIAGECSVIIPAKPLTELQRMLKDNEAPVCIRFGDSQAQFETDSVRLTSRLLDGKFPNYERVIPAAPERTVTIDRADLLSAVQRVYIVAKGAAEKAVFAFGKTMLEITAEASDVGKAFEELPIENDGENLVIAFNAKYLVEILGVLDCERVTLAMTGALNPAVLRIEGQREFLYVVMPMAI